MALGEKDAEPCMGLASNLTKTASHAKSRTDTACMFNMSGTTSREAMREIRTVFFFVGN